MMMLQMMMSVLGFTSQLLLLLLKVMKMLLGEIERMLVAVIVARFIIHHYSDEI